MTGAIDNSDDSLLVIKIRDNNEDAFKSLYYRYSKKVYYFSLRYLGSKEEAEELVQSVFANVWERRKILDENHSVKNYIYTSAVNYITNYLKREAVRNRYDGIELSKKEYQTDSTYEQVFFHDLEKSINLIIDTLPSQQQKIFRLSRYEGLTNQEIAGKLDLSKRTVENQLYRVLKVLRQFLKRDFF